MRAAALGLLVCLAASADPVDDAVRKELQARGIPGAALAVVRDGRVEKIAGYGVADRESGRPVTPGTRFQVGSLSKQFTATAVMLLVEGGKARLEDPICKYVPASPDSWNGITVRHLLTHTSGLPDWTESPAFSFEKEFTDAEFIAMISAMPLHAKPGETWAYCSAGYGLLGLLIEKAGGKPYEDFMRERVFEPLGMKSTLVHRNGRKMEPRDAAGYVLGDEGARPGGGRRPRITNPSGGVISTIEDLARYESALAKKPLLGRESMKAMWEPVRLSSGESAPYGFGWVVDLDGGRHIVRHGGATGGGFESTFIRYPGERLTIILLVNAWSRKGWVDEIAGAVAGMYLK